MSKNSQKYKSNNERNQYLKSKNVFKVSEGDIAEFYYVPLQGPLRFLSMISIKHLLLVVKSKTDSNKIMSMGFYPADGNILGSLLNPKDGYLWSPDPHYIPNIAGFEPAYFYDTEKPIVYNLTEKQAELIHTTLHDTRCKLKNGKSSSGIVKRDRLECPIETYKYCPMPGRKNARNCVTWLHQVFPELYNHINGTFFQLAEQIPC